MITRDNLKEILESIIETNIDDILSQKQHHDLYSLELSCTSTLSYGILRNTEYTQEEYSEICASGGLFLDADTLENMVSVHQITDRPINKLLNSL